MAAKTPAQIRKETDRAHGRTRDSFTNGAAALGFGGGSQQDTATYRLGFQTRNRATLEAAYRTGWIPRIIVDCVAEDMTRAGVTLNTDKIEPSGQEVITKAIERLKIWGTLCDGVRWGRLYGGAIVVLLIDGQDLSAPLDLETVSLGTFKGMIAFDRWQVAPTINETITELGPDLGKPKFYKINPGAKALIGEKIHHSRVFRFEGDPLPYYQQMAEGGWGASVLECLWDRMIAFDSTTEGAAQLVYKAHLRVFSVKGLREIMLNPTALQGLTAMVDFMRQAQSNEGISLIDAQDTYTPHSYTFAGLSDLMLQFVQQISGASQIPLVRLYGQSPAGMNATGESDLLTWYDNVARKQKVAFTGPLGVIFELLCRSELGVEFPAGAAIDWNPLWQLKPAEKAEIAGKTVEAVAKASDMGILPDQVALRELRQSSNITGIFSHISDKDISSADTDPPKPPPPVVPPEPGADEKNGTVVPPTTD